MSPDGAAVASSTAATESDATRIDGQELGRGKRVRVPRHIFDPSFLLPSTTTPPPSQQPLRLCGGFTRNART